MSIYQPRWYQQEACDAVFDFIIKPENRGKNPLAALPTGTGKSLVLAMIAKRAMTTYPSTRVLMLTHVKELVEQNAEKLSEYWEGAPLGVWSSGLKKREWHTPCTYAGIGTVRSNVALLGRRDIVMIDEAHRVSPSEEATYKDVLSQLRGINPNMVVVGLTATPYRQGQGMLTEPYNKRGQDDPVLPLFNDIVYDMCSFEGFNRLLDEGFLAPLTSRPTKMEVDVTDAKSRGGDYVLDSLAEQVNTPEKIVAVCDEIIECGEERRSWLVFASGLQNADLLATELNSRGYSAAVVSANTKNRDELLKAFKAGELRCIVNNDVLTTGFDYPALDLIAVVRATKSTSLWVQMLGRGTRPHPDKEDCLVLDFAGNTKRLGPINDPVLPRGRGKGSTAEAPVKICPTPTCGVYLHASARVCDHCGHLFLGHKNITEHASTLELIAREEKRYEWRELDNIGYKHTVNKFTGARVMQVVYTTKNRERYYLQHTFNGAGTSKASQDWWLLHARAPVPLTNDEAMSRIPEIKTPFSVEILISARTKNPKVVNYGFARPTVPVSA